MPNFRLIRSRLQAEEASEKIRSAFEPFVLYSHQFFEPLKGWFAEQVRPYDAIFQDCVWGESRLEGKAVDQ